MLLKWEALILNHIYGTNHFDQIVMQSSAIENIDYYQPLNVYRSIMKIDQLQFPSKKWGIQDFVTCAHTLCQSQSI